MFEQRAQATVEWVGLVLIMAVVLAAVASASGAVNAGWLPRRLACAPLPEACARATPHHLVVSRSRHQGATPRLAAGGGVGVTFVVRHRRTIRKVVVATAIGAGVAAVCAGAIIGTNLIGAVGCGSTIVTGGYAAYRNATD